jgi:hypothetical protein
MRARLASKFDTFLVMRVEIDAHKSRHAHRREEAGDETFKRRPRRAEPFTEIVTGKTADNGRKADAQPKMGRCTNPGRKPTMVDGSLRTVKLFPS